jgi:CDP-diacylglycerol--glycerol-3-phosphate 3-phosphatidyltransferase
VNVPNQITLVRLVLAVIVFVLIPWGQYAWALVLFLLAALTDWLDGYWARRTGQVTKLGRVLDPFVDKFLVCGAFIYLAAEPQSGIGAWMAVVVVARELLVTVLRSFLEGEGIDFSAKMAGKLKMVFQCGAVAASLWSLALSDQQPPQWLSWGLPSLVWLAIITTVYSGIDYVFLAFKLLRR